MKTPLFKIFFILVFIHNQAIFSQEWKNLRAYQKETHHKKLLEGCWLKKDRKNKTVVWKRANAFNLTLKNGNRKYKSIHEIRDFYLWFDTSIKEQGHEMQWIGAAVIAADKLSHLENKFVQTLIVKNPELVAFVKEGSQKVFEYTFPKLKTIYFSKKIIKGITAKNWDINHSDVEQCVILTPLYEKLSKKSFSQLEKMAKGQGIYALGVPKKLRLEGDLKDCEARILHGVQKLLPFYLSKKKHL